MTNTAKFHQDIELKSGSRILNLRIDSFENPPTDPNIGQVYFDEIKSNFGIFAGLDKGGWKYSGEVDSLVDPELASGTQFR